MARHTSGPVEPVRSGAGEAPVLEAAPVTFGAVDDHPVMLHGIAAVAARYPDRVCFVGTAETVTELLERWPDLDVALLDLRLGDLTRPRDNVVRLAEAGQRVLVFTGGDQEALISDAVEAGAQGVVLKSQADGHELVRSIEAVAAGALVLSPEVAAVIERDSRMRPRLSPRELETLRLLAQGLADKQIARMMDVGEATVKENLKRIRVKYVDRGRPAPSRVDLHQRALEDGYAGDHGAASGPEGERRDGSP